MRQTIANVIPSTIVLFVTMVLYFPAARADDRSSTATAAKMPPSLAKRVSEITDAILANHVDPPVRQQMILEGVKALYRAANIPVPGGLSRRVSAVSSPEQLTGLLAEIWPKSMPKPITAKTLEEAFLEGLLASIPGGAHLVSAKESTVQEQFEGNRYVGIHIAMGMNEHENRPSIGDVIEGGPADRAGVKKDDYFEMIDGIDTKGMTVEDAVDRLRGQEGTSVTIKVCQPGSTLIRTYTIMRGQHPRSTVEGLRKRPAGDWNCTLDASGPIAYLRINQIGASTPHDLRKLARRIESQGRYGVILDLRGVGGTSVHPAALLADSLLSGGVIGRERTAKREVTYLADPDAIFRGLPIAVLVDERTSGTAEWLAAALQDNQRAKIVGTPTAGANTLVRAGPRGNSDVRTRVSIADGAWSFVLVTGYLERADGRRLSRETNAQERMLPRLAHTDTGPLKVETGVIPDRLVSPSPRGPAQTRAHAKDAVLEAAIAVLRLALIKFI